MLEDDADLRELLVLGMQSIGAKVLFAAGSVQEMQKEWTGRDACACAVLDVNLGAHSLSGIEAARWLRRGGYRGGIVFLTGHAASFPEMAGACRELDATLIEKPCAFERLAATITEHFQ